MHFVEIARNNWKVLLFQLEVCDISFNGKVPLQFGFLTVSKEGVRNGENGGEGRTRLSCAGTFLAQFLCHGLNC